MSRELRRKILASVFLCAALVVLASLLTYHPHDLAFEAQPANDPIHNAAGILGAYVAFLGLKGFGWAAWWLPVCLLTWAWTALAAEPEPRLPASADQRGQAGARLPTSGDSRGQAGWTWLGLAALLASTSAAASLISPDPVQRVMQGGAVGLALGDVLLTYVGRVGAWLVSGLLIILSGLLTTRLVLISGLLWCGRMLRDGIARWHERRKSQTTAPVVAARPQIRPAATPAPAAEQSAPKSVVERPTPAAPRVTIAKPAPAAKPTSPPKPPRVEQGAYQLPSLDLLETPPPITERRLKEDLEANARILEETLRDFGIEAKVAEVDRGPIITRYELSPAPGVKVNRITGLSDDIALVMKAQSVRIVAPIPGKARVGIEVPNSTAAMVYVKEILESPAFQQSKFRLPLNIGKDVSGAPIVSDLSDCPHVLIAGATGSGKTVCINSLLVSLLFMAHPDDVKFLMIDPKRVELAAFNGLPHLIAPVVTEAKKAAGALQWAVSEMEDRYRLLARVGVRNIDAFNERIAREPLLMDGQAVGKMPYLIIVVDELADLMMVSSQDVEAAITRLAQLSRAVGIHILLATQRPSVDVITGVIKANFPARISFQVASKVDSRTVLDANGADKLLGKGDLLFLRPGTAKPIRAQGSFLTDAEIERVVRFITAQREPVYHAGILKAQEQHAAGGIQGGGDERYEEARRLVLDTGVASTSHLQRRLRLGYARAARLLDMMEQEGIVGPFRGSKPREILVERVADSAASMTAEEETA